MHSRPLSPLFAVYVADTCSSAAQMVRMFIMYRQDNSDVAMDDNGDFTVVWQSYGQDGSSWGV